MTTLDLVIGLTLIGGLVIGYRSGLIKQVISFFGLVIGFLLAYNLMRSVGDVAAASLGISKDIAPLLGFALVFLVVQVVVFALIRLGESLLDAMKLSAVNRVLGGGVGLFKAALVLSVVFLVLGKLAVPSDLTRTRSALYAPVASVLPAAWEYVTRALPRVESLSKRFGRAVEDQLPNAEPGPAADDSTR